MSGAPFLGTPADIRRWAENRRIVNAVEVRELTSAWNSPERACDAALAGALSIIDKPAMLIGGLAVARDSPA